MIREEDVEEKMKMKNEVCEEREGHLDDGIYNVFNQFNLKELVTHMQNHIQRMEMCQREKEMVNKIYGGKYEMTVFVHYLTLTYFRGLRNYHLKNKLLEDFDGDLE